MSPRFNHVAVSVPAALLEDQPREELVGFYRDVFGWEEMATMTRPGAQVVLQAWSYDQFVFVVAEDEPMQCPRMDHFGLAVDDRAEFDQFLQRARAKAADDPDVDFIEAQVEQFGDFLTLHNFYVGYRLPMNVEVQLWEWADGFAPTGPA